MKKRIIYGCLSIAMSAGMAILRLLHFNTPLFREIFCLILYAAVIYFGAGILVSGFRQLRYRVIREEFVTSLGMIMGLGCGIGSVVISARDGDCGLGAVMIPAGIMTGAEMIVRAFRLRGKAPEADIFAGRIPKKAIALIGGVKTEFPTDRLSSGMLVSIDPGETVPCDGEIIAGSSDVDERTVTGQIKTAFRRTGDTVKAGSKNLSGYLTVRYDGENEMAKLKKLYDEGKKPATVNKREMRYCTGVLGVAAGVVLVMLLYLIFGSGENWYSAAVLVYMCACPAGMCAVKLLSGLRAGKKFLKEGIELHNPEFIDAVREIDNILVNTSGTLTVGKYSVMEIICSGGADRDSVLRMAAGVCGCFEGPEYAAVKSCCENSGITVPPCISAVRKPGAIQGLIDGFGVAVKTYEKGDEAVFSECDVTVSDSCPGLCVYCKEQPVGLIILEDRLKSTTAAAYKILNEKEALVMPFSRESFGVLAKEPESDETEKSGPLDGEEKAICVERLCELGRYPAVVADNLCDAPALKRAYCSFAMASGDSDVKKAADAVLLRNDLRDIAGAADAAERIKKRENGICMAVSVLRIIFALAAFLTAALGYVLPAAAVCSVGIAVSVLVGLI